jgi:hypothetical protein
LPFLAAAGGGILAPAALCTVYSPVRCVLCLNLKSDLLLYYNKCRNISIVPCNLHYLVPLKKIQNVNQGFRKYMCALRTCF